MVNLNKSIKRHYVKSDSPSLKSNFLQQLDLYWMYCPDNVVIKQNAFLETVKINFSTEVQKETTLGEMMVTIENSLFNDSK